LPTSNPFSKTLEAHPTPFSMQYPERDKQCQLLQGLQRLKTRNHAYLKLWRNLGAFQIKMQNENLRLRIQMSHLTGRGE
jgi:hypothetical protein